MVETMVAIFGQYELTTPLRILRRPGHLLHAPSVHIKLGTPGVAHVFLGRSLIIFVYERLAMQQVLFLSIL